MRTRLVNAAPSRARLGCYIGDNTWDNRLGCGRALGMPSNLYNSGARCQVDLANRIPTKARRGWSKTRARLTPWPLPPAKSAPFFIFLLDSQPSADLVVFASQKLATDSCTKDQSAAAAHQENYPDGPARCDSNNCGTTGSLLVFLSCGLDVRGANSSNYPAFCGSVCRIYDRSCAVP
jgi:hypothetical protein